MIALPIDLTIQIAGFLIFAVGIWTGIFIAKVLK